MLGRPSPAMVVACIALIVALGGTGYAATQLPPKSVGQKQLRNGAVGNLQLRDGSVTAGKLHKDAVTSDAIRNGGVKAADLAKGILPAAASSVHQTSGDPIALRLTIKVCRQLSGSPARSAALEQDSGRTRHSGFPVRWVARAASMRR